MRAAAAAIFARASRSDSALAALASVVPAIERARQVLDEQGARPLRAIIDFDEAWMEVRRGEAGDPRARWRCSTPRAARWK